MVVLLICIRDFDYVIRYGPYPQIQVQLKKKSGKESQSRVSHPELGSDPPIGSVRDSGHDSAHKHEKGKKKKNLLRRSLFMCSLQLWTTITFSSEL